MLNRSTILFILYVWIGLIYHFRKTPIVYEFRYAFWEEVGITIKTDKSSLSLAKDDFPEISVVMYNHSLDPITMLLPNLAQDKNISPWVGWAVYDLTRDKPLEMNMDDYTGRSIQIDKYGVKGNFKNISAPVLLKPFQSIDFSKRILKPKLPDKPGKYSVIFYYKNDPFLLYGYLADFGQQDQVFKILSNELIFEIID